MGDSLRGRYTRPNLFRIRKFYEAYRDDKKVSPLVRQLPWTHHLLILGQAKLPEDRHFYILAAIVGACGLAALYMLPRLHGEPMIHHRDALRAV